MLSCPLLKDTTKIQRLSVEHYAFSEACPQQVRILVIHSLLLTSKANIQEFHSHQIGKYALNCIIAHNLDGSIQEHAIWVLVNIMSGKPDIKIFLHELNIAQIVTETMELHR